MRSFNPKHMLSFILLAGLMLTLIFGMTISTVQPVSAQRPQRTPSAGGAGAIDLSGLNITLPAGDDLMATANAIAASMGEDMDSLMATANVLLTAMPTFTGGLSPDDLSEWLESWSAYSLSFDSDTGGLVVTVTIDEDMLNTIIEAALTEADTTVSSISVDFDDGLIVVSAEDISLSRKLIGDLELTTELTVDDGEIVVTLTDASLNRKALPPAALTELTALLEEGFNSNLQTPTGLDYSVDDVAVIDEGIEVTLSLELSME